MYRILGSAPLYTILAALLGNNHIFATPIKSIVTNTSTERYEDLLFSIRPPEYYIGNEGETIQYDCRPATNSSTTRVHWVVPHTVPRLKLAGGENESGVYVYPNNTLLIQHMKLDFHGFYKCVIHQESGYHTAVMNLHVVKLNSYDYGFRTMVGTVAAFVVVSILVLFVVGYRFCGKTKGSDKLEVTDRLNTEEHIALS
ncbi:uncharacterized protein LOC121382384 [Gigantopelta aegis]|uniref:uncharacterized protein LOC121382384 n=1 Tax=Gigantopelta aegis TaxID=1735272 RepID=UPI001B88DE58|nr:uncharacterized protein LOC121382384 [Gigantopelta aegis]